MSAYRIIQVRAAGVHRGFAGGPAGAGAMPFSGHRPFPTRHPLPAPFPLQERMVRLEQLRLELDSRRRTVNELQGGRRQHVACRAWRPAAGAPSGRAPRCLATPAAAPIAPQRAPFRGSFPLAAPVRPARPSHPPPAAQAASRASRPRWAARAPRARRTWRPPARRRSTRRTRQTVSSRPAQLAPAGLHFMQATCAAAGGPAPPLPAAPSCRPSWRTPPPPPRPASPRRRPRRCRHGRAVQGL
jgi:hypothetical protein